MRIYIDLCILTVIVILAYAVNKSEERRIEQKKELYECREQLKESRQKQERKSLEEVRKRLDGLSPMDWANGVILDEDEQQQLNLDILNKILRNPDHDSCYMVHENIFKAVRIQTATPWPRHPDTAPSGIDD